MRGFLDRKNHCGYSTEEGKKERGVRVQWGLSFLCLFFLLGSGEYCGLFVFGIKVGGFGQEKELMLN